jgi:hypothetical protein
VIFWRSISMRVSDRTELTRLSFQSEGPSEYLQGREHRLSIRLRSFVIQDAFGEVLEFAAKVIGVLQLQLKNARPSV